MTICVDVLEKFIFPQLEEWIVVEFSSVVVCCHVLETSFVLL
jgi:hypothetical protein